VARTGGEILGEHALQDGEPDRLGFGEIAERIARAIVDRASTGGLVIGIDGRWGSGKSSLLHLIERSLGKLPARSRPTILNFRPWLVGDRDALLNSLFGELAEKIASAALEGGDATKETIQKSKKAAEAVRRFAASISKAGSLVETAGELWGPAKWIGKGFQGIGKMVSGEKPPSDLASLKAAITRDLLDLGHRFIVTIDDVDRLEPLEVIEVLRLVRSVADFPNVIYLLCYDAERLAEAIKSAAKVEDGAAFLEKIVQLTVMVPSPEPFELRQWFAEELERIVGPVENETGLERLRMVIDQEGGQQLRTPRSVVRTLDSLRFFWPAIRHEKVDLADLVWLQMIKDGAPALYRWVESYVAGVATTSFGTAKISEPNVAARLKELQRICDDGQLDDVMYRHFLSEILPGLAVGYGGDEPPVKIHQKINAGERQTAIEGRRLASADHYRLYFSLIGPSHSVTQASMDAFWSAVDDGPDSTASILLDLHRQRALGTLRKSDVLFERLRAMNPTLWTEARARNLLLAFGLMMDDAYRENPDEHLFIVTSWDRAERLVPILYAQFLNANLRLAMTEHLFGSSPSVGWLTSLFRREILAHGRWGDQKQSSEKWYLSDGELSRAIDLLIPRYRSMSMDQILDTPRPIHIFYGWNQSGDEAGPRKLVADATKSDEGIVRFLSQMTSVGQSSSRGNYTSLRRDAVTPFLDYDAALRHLKAIASGGSTDLAAKAQRLLEQAEIEEED